MADAIERAGPLKRDMREAQAEFLKCDSKTRDEDHIFGAIQSAIDSESPADEVIDELLECLPPEA